jgi:hypothetical protein
MDWLLGAGSAAPAVRAFKAAVMSKTSLTARTWLTLNCQGASSERGNGLDGLALVDVDAPKVRLGMCWVLVFQA